MSAVSVRVVQSSTDGSGDAGAGPAEAAGVDPELLEVLPFSSGTVQALRTFGVVHLYRPTPAPEATATTGAHGAPQPLTLPVTDTVCALGVPGSLSLADFCAFVGAMLPRVKDMRVIRDERGHPAARGALDAAVGHPLLAGQEAPVFTYSVLLRFDAASSAEEFFRFYHGRAFNSLEPDVCHLLFVKDVEFTSHASQPPPGLTELPACPVCLERLDTHISGIVTTVCNHAFHAACLRNWVDASCPVCRYSQAPPDSSRCEVCGTRDNLWICLVCGAVGCGRYANGHAVSHWRESGHCYSLELATQRVWDYLGDGYVHRLIASKTHGHLVELTPPATRTTRRRRGGGAAGGADCGDAADGDGAGAGGDGDDQLDDDPGLDEVLLASKLDAVGLEYNQLLSSQLESQREYFQTLISSARADADRARADADAARQSAEAADVRAAVATERATASGAQAKDAERALKLAERRLEDTAVKLSACAKELDTLRQWNADLIAGKREAEAKADAVAAQARAAAAAHDARVQDLEEQVRDLATFLDAQKAIEGAGDKNTVVTIRAPAAEASQTPRDALRAKLQAAKGERGRK